MRLLFTFAGGHGHLEPLLPLARAAEDVGHVVAFAGRPWMVPSVESAGFPAFPAGSDIRLTPVRRPLAKVDLEHEMRAVGPGFGRRVAQARATDLLPLCTQWQPDLLVCDEVDFGALVVGERLAIPYATVLVIASGSFVRPEFVAEFVNEVRAAHGLRPDPQLAARSRYLVLSPIPLSYRDPGVPVPATTHACRLYGQDLLRRERLRIPWRSRSSDLPTVYFTLGTVFNLESGDLFNRVLGGLRELPINLVVTVGPDVDPLELGPQPENVHIERYIPQAALLPHCELVVSHGGSGSVMGALAHGVPLIVLPLGADQPLNAARCEALGVGRTLDALTASPRAIRDAVAGMLADPSYRQAAERFRAENSALPDPSSVVQLFERLATEKRPILSGAN